MIAVANAVIIKNNMSLIKHANEEPARVPACCTAAAHCSLLDDVYHCVNKFQPTLCRYVCAASFSCSASNIETLQNLPQGHRIYLWSRGDLIESCCILESPRSIHPSNHRAERFILSTNGAVCIAPAAPWNSAM